MTDRPATSIAGFITLTQRAGTNDRKPAIIRADEITGLVPIADAAGWFTKLYFGEGHSIPVRETPEQILALIQGYA